MLRSHLKISFSSKLAEGSTLQLVSLCCYCDKKVVKKVKCRNCGSIYHKSCSNRKICCNKQEIIPESENLTSEEFEDNLTNDALFETLKFENKLLIQLNSELTSNNKLLKERILTLEEELSTHKNKNQSTSKTNEGKNEQEINMEKIKDIISLELQNYFNKYQSIINKDNLQENAHNDNNKQKMASEINVNKGQKTQDNRINLE